MKQSIVEKYGQEFLKIFGRDLTDFMAFHGFDIIRFEETFFPEITDNYSRSLKSDVEWKYGTSARILIMDILDWQTEKKFMNSELEGVEDGKECIFITNDQQLREGKIYFPFALTKDTPKKYTIHHLPTGTFVMKNLTKKKADEILRICIEHLSWDLRSDTFEDHVPQKVNDYLQSYLLEV